MPVIGNPRTFHKKFKFIVEIDGVVSAGFQKCSELSVEVANVQYYEGGSLIPNKSPGRLTFADVTLERGATSDKDLFDWLTQVADAAANAGLNDPAFKRNLDFVQQDRDGSTPPIASSPTRPSPPGDSRSATGRRRSGSAGMAGPRRRASRTPA